uniref:AAA domain-containing protein n=1 Tax=Parastrongyloides trichosuri TaxID=131310 RepID=A0A0N4ZL91_PARTI
MDDKLSDDCRCYRFQHNALDAYKMVRRLTNTKKCNENDTSNEIWKLKKLCEEHKTIIINQKREIYNITQERDEMIVKNKFLNLENEKMHKNYNELLLTLAELKNKVFITHNKLIKSKKEYDEINRKKNDNMDKVCKQYNCCKKMLMLTFDIIKEMKKNHINKTLNDKSIELLNNFDVDAALNYIDKESFEYGSNENVFNTKTIRKASLKEVINDFGKEKSNNKPLGERNEKVKSRRGSIKDCKLKNPIALKSRKSFHLKRKLSNGKNQLPIFNNMSQDPSKVISYINDNTTKNEKVYDTRGEDMEKIKRYFESINKDIYNSYDNNSTNKVTDNLGDINLVDVYEVEISHGELFSMILGSAIVAGMGSLLYWNKCKVLECCESPWIEIKANEFEKELRKKLHGQHIAIEAIENLVKGHLKLVEKGKSKKSLVLSFHGWPGIGKTYTSSIIAEHLYKKGFLSKYVVKHYATRDFPLQNHVETYKNDLQQWISGNLTECTKTLFIFDEIDKMSPKILDAVAIFGQENVYVNGKKANDAIFIFISNAGGHAISAKAKDFYERKIFREDLRIEDFENVLRENAINDGGLEDSDMILRGIIDVFVPFLPLEKKHVENCIDDLLNEKGYNDTSSNLIIKEYLFKQITFTPKENPIFAVSGCRMLDKKMELIAERYYPKSIDP